MSTIKGKLIVKNETETFGSNGFRKRTFVIETDDKYPQKILLELTQSKCDLLDQFNLNDELEVSYNLNGREWVNPQGETKYFNSVQAWKITKLSGQPVKENLEPISENNNDNDLPF